MQQDRFSMPSALYEPRPKRRRVMPFTLECVFWGLLLAACAIEIAALVVVLKDIP